MNRAQMFAPKRAPGPWPIEDYASKHLAGYTLPKPLEEFARSYAIRSSQRCELEMVEVLTGQAKDLLTAADFQRFGQWAESGGQIGHLLRAVTSSGVAVSPSELASVLMAPKVEEKLAVNSALDDDVANIKEVCAKRFKPIYVPLVALSHSGFECPDRMLWSDLKLDSDQIEQLDLWPRIMFLCETADIMKVNGRESVETGDHLKRITLEPSSRTTIDKVKALTREQLDELRQNIRSRTSSDIDQLKRNPRQNLPLSLQGQMDPEGARWFASCLKVPTEGDEQANSHESSTKEPR